MYPLQKISVMRQEIQRHAQGLRTLQWSNIRNPEVRSVITAQLSQCHKTVEYSMEEIDKVYTIICSSLYEGEDFFLRLMKQYYNLLKKSYYLLLLALNKTVYFPPTPFPTH